MATITVTNTNDSGVGSLRQAVLDATSGDNIVFDTGLSGSTIFLTSGQSTIDKGITIDGDVTGNDNKADITLFGSGGFRHFEVPPTGNLTLNSLIVTADHALLRHGYLINAACLVGQPGVTWAPPAPRVFYHIETEAHEVLLANGCPAESFSALQGRAAFDNRATAPARIFPEMDLPRVAAPRLMPFVTQRSA